jgi:hypothetical protein
MAAINTADRIMFDSQIAIGRTELRTEKPMIVIDSSSGAQSGKLRLDQQWPTVYHNGTAWRLADPNVEVIEGILVWCQNQRAAELDGSIMGVPLDESIR